MITGNLLFPQIDRDAERRRALAKVYRLLIRLADEAENQSALPNATKEHTETVVESTLKQLELAL